MVDESSLPPPRHEPTDVTERVIWIGTPALALSVIAMTLVVLWLFAGRTVDRTMQLPLARYPMPELQVSPRDDMAKFYAEELQRLNSTGWVDKGHGIAHIPIAVAMQKVATEGIPDWPAQPAPPGPTVSAQPSNRPPLAADRAALPQAAANTPARPATP